MDIHSILTALGLRSNEVKIYLAILDLGMAPMSVIARKSGLKRPTTYGVVKTLRKRGLTDCFMSKGVRLYSVVSPATVLGQYKELLQEFEQKVPALVSQHERLLVKPRFHLFEGKKELQRVYEKILKEPLFHAYLSPELASEYFSQKWLKEQWDRRKGMSKRRAQLLIADTAMAQKIMGHLPASIAEARFFTSQAPLAQEIFITESAVTTFSFQEGFAVQIQSTNSVEMQKALFQKHWMNRSK